MQSGLLLDVVVRESASILELLAGEDKALLVRGDALLVLDLRLHIVDSVRALDLESDGLARQGLHKNLHGDAGSAEPPPKHKRAKESVAFRVEARLGLSQLTTGLPQLRTGSPTDTSRVPRHQ